MNEDRNEFIHQLHIKFYRRLIRTAYRETGDIETASDLVQEVFVIMTPSAPTTPRRPGCTCPSIIRCSISAA